MKRRYNNPEEYELEEFQLTRRSNLFELRIHPPLFVASIFGLGPLWIGLALAALVIVLC